MLVLTQAGLPTGPIAKRLGVGQRTIQRWLAGEHNGTFLREKLKAQGYTGSMRSVYRRLAKWWDHPQKLGTFASPESFPRSPLEDADF